MTVELILPLFAAFAAASQRMRSPFSFSLLLVPLAAGMQGIRSSALVSGFFGQPAGAPGPIMISPQILGTLAVILLLGLALEQSRDRNIVGGREGWR